jgi:hypothetical protein
MDAHQRAVVQQTLEMANAALHEALEHIAKLKEENAALRQLLEQPEPVQEPVAYSVGRTLHWHEGRGVNDAQLYTTPPAQPADAALDKMADNARDLGLGYDKKGGAA